MSNNRATRRSSEARASSTTSQLVQAPSSRTQLGKPGVERNASFVLRFSATSSPPEPVSSNLWSAYRPLTDAVSFSTGKQKASKSGDFGDLVQRSPLMLNASAKLPTKWQSSKTDRLVRKDGRQKQAEFAIVLEPIIIAAFLPETRVKKKSLPQLHAPSRLPDSDCSTGSQCRYQFLSPKTNKFPTSDMPRHISQTPTHSLSSLPSQPSIRILVRREKSPGKLRCPHLRQPNIGPVGDTALFDILGGIGE
jgi:hypothetical protein